MTTRTISSQIEDPRCVKILHPINLKLSNLLGQLENIGPIIEFHSLEGHEKNRKVVLCRFREAKHALEAKRINQWIVRTNQNEATYSAEIRTRIFTNTTLSAPTIIPSARPISNRRIFCKLPYSVTEKYRETQFFDHFSVFGPMVYHQVVPDARGRPAFGYIEYCRSEDALEAVEKSDRQYGAKFADERKRRWDGRKDPETVYHWLCATHVDQGIFMDHQKTCQWQYERALRTARKRNPSQMFPGAAGFSQEPNNQTVKSKSAQLKKKDQGTNIGNSNLQVIEEVDETVPLEDGEITAEIHPEDRKFLETAL